MRMATIKPNSNRNVNEGVIMAVDLERVRQSVTRSQRMMTDGDLVLAISRLHPNERKPETVQSKITNFIHQKGQTSLNKWQISAIVRKTMGQNTAVTQ